MPDKDGDDEKKSTKSVVNKKQKPDIQTEGLKKIGKNVKNFFDKTLKFDSKYSNEPSVRDGTRTPQSTHMFKHVPSVNKDGTTSVYGQKGADFTKQTIKKGSKSILSKGIEYVKNNPKQAGIIGAAAVGTGLAYAGIKGLQKRGERKAIAKSVVRQLEKKKMMGEEGYDIARDMGRVKPSKDKKDATTLPVSDEVKKTQKVVKGPSALERVKAKYGKSVMNVGKKKVKEELDLTQVAEAFGGYITEVEVKGKGPIKKIVADLKKKGKLDPEADTAVGNELSPNTKAGIEAQARRENLGGYDDAKPTSVRRGTAGKSLEDIKKGLEQDRSDYRDMRKLRAQERRAEKLKDPKFRASETLRKAKQTDVKGGSSVKRGDPVPQEEIPTKKKPVPEIGGYQFNTFKDSEMKKRKTFKQAFGKPTGADPVTGKPTYMRPGVLDKSGKPRRAERQNQTTKKTVSQVKGDIEFKDLLKKGGATGDFSDTMTADQRAKGQAKRDKRMTEVGVADDPFSVDTSQAAKDVAKQFGTKPVKGGLPMGEPTVPKEVDRQTKPDLEKIGSQLKKTKIGFKDFDRKMRDAKVDADIERTIAGKNTRVSQTQVVGGGGGGNRNRTRTGTGTPDNPEVMKNGSAKNMIDVTNIKEPSKMSQAKDNARDFAKKDPVAALATYDLGKGLLGKILKTRLPRVPTPRAIQVSAKS